MRRKEKQFTDIIEMEAVIAANDICHLGLCNDNTPYIVPINFGYKDQKLYFHSAKEGKKIDMIKSNPNACFVFENDLGVVPGETACKWTHKFQSVMGSGTIRFIEDLDEKKAALDIFMAQYSDETPHTYPDKQVENTCIFVLDIKEMTGKQTQP